MSARTLIVGLDGASFAVAGPLMAQGRLPVLSRLASEGASGPLRSTTPPLTLPAWASVLTGCNPGRHGIFDFVQPAEAGGLTFTNGSHRQVPTLHRILSDAGGRVASVAVPGTWPPEALNGVMIAGFDSPVSTRIDASFCHPPGLYAELRRRFGGLRFADFQESRLGQRWHRRAARSLLREITRKTALCEWLIENDRWGLFMVVFGESDTAAHHFWMFHDPESPRHVQRPELAGVINQVYEALDSALGRLLEAARPERLCVCSDHGFGGAGVHGLYLNRFLETRGWLTLRPSAGRAQQVRLLASGLLPAPWQGHLFRALPAFALDSLETRARTGAILEGSVASDEMNYATTIRARAPLSGPQLARLRADLLSWEVDGEPVVRAVHHRSELYRGDAVALSPELILELHDRGGYSYTLLPSTAAAPGMCNRMLAPHEWVGGKGLGMNGSHRPEGLGLFWGDGVQKGAVEAGVEDIAPTLLHLSGRAVPDHMDGKVLFGGLAGTDPGRWTGELPAPHTATAGGARVLRKRLQRLGYL